MNIVVTRCSNYFGPYQFPERVIPLFITNLLESALPTAFPQAVSWTADREN